MVNIIISQKRKNEDKGELYYVFRKVIKVILKKKRMWNKNNRADS